MTKATTKLLREKQPGESTKMSAVLQIMRNTELLQIKSAGQYRRTMQFISFSYQLQEKS